MASGSLTQWNRLESRPRKEDFSRALRAEIRDPLWMMTRQWQMGELTGEDTSSPVTAKIFYETTRLNKLQLGATDPLDIQSALDDLPLETIVERENIQVIDRQNSEAFINDLHLSNAFRKRTIALIKKQFTNPTEKNILDALKAHDDLQYDLPETQNEPLSIRTAEVKVNPTLHRHLSALHSRSFHGGKLYVQLKNNEKLASFVSGLSSTDKNKLNEIGVQLVEWFDKLFNQNKEERNPAWHPNHLEYQFNLSAPEQTNEHITLCSKEYFGGRLDWYVSDYDKAKGANSKLSENLDKSLLSKGMDQIFPAEAEFIGMPHNRWWEFENGSLNFGEIQPNKTDLGKILFAEFGLLYGNDWSIMPLTLPDGSLTKIDHIEIKDNFGQYTISKQYKNYNENKDWGLFQIFSKKASDEKDINQYLYLPPNVHDLMQGEPIEKINFIRDEMANMVWGIECLVPNGLGAGIDGNLIAGQIKEYYLKLATPDTPDLENNAKIQYTLATQVPENWIAFIPVKLNAANILSRQIQLQRAVLPRIIEGVNTPMRIEARSSLLLKEKSPYYIFEEEIPRSGTIVCLQWQRTRMANGKTVVWLGRKKTNGRGEGFSNLAYDQISPKKK